MLVPCVLSPKSQENVKGPAPPEAVASKVTGLPAVAVGTVGNEKSVRTDVDCTVTKWLATAESP